MARGGTVATVSDAAETVADGRPLLEVGWVLDRRLEDVDREAAEGASQVVAERLREVLPEFEWRMPTLPRELVQAPREEPVSLLEAAAFELSIHHWDYALTVTGSDLVSHYSPFALAVPSRVLASAVVSTFHLDPLVRRQAVPLAERRATMQQRLARLALYLLGHLAGLPRTSRRDGVMTPPRTERDLDRDVRFDAGELVALRAELGRVADQRVEEESGAEQESGASFHARAAWRNRSEILGSLHHGRSWEFPFRMGRLTTAAVSALAILTCTAECWEIGSRLGVRTAAGLAGGALLATTLYVLRRQRLLALEHGIRRTEQLVVTRVAVVLFVCTGMAVTYLVLFLAAVLLGQLLVRPALVARWTALEPGAVGWATYALQGVFTSSVALLVGALGASFEGQSYVRHIAYVDEEL